MFKPSRRRALLIVVSSIVIAGLVILTVRYQHARARAHEEETRRPKAEAPRDLQKLREPFSAGVDALQRHDGADAVKHLSSFDFGQRAVEEYRLYYLANGYQLTGDMNSARLTLARLWRRTPRLVYANDVGFNLASLYADHGDWTSSAGVYAGLARRADVPAVAAAARWSTAVERLKTGDVSGALYAARNIVIHNPRSEQAKDAVALVRTLTGTSDKDPLPITPSERLDRAVALMRSADPQTGFEELTVLEPVAPHLASEIRLQRGIALYLLKRYEDSIKVLEPLTSGPYKYAIPALRHAAKDYAVVSASIDPTVEKTIKERKRVGSVKVRVGKGKKRRTVTKPKYQTVFRKIKLVDLAKKKKKEEYDRLSGERLKDLLSLPIDDALRLETLNSLADRAAAKNQTEYLQQLVPQIIKIDRAADPALQYFWDKAWNLYTRGDLTTSRQLFRFISSTYTHENVRRQAEYWYARAAERQGNKEEAAGIYQRLASSPYEDIYAQHAIARGAKRQPNTSNPLDKKGPDWREIAEKEMPDELEIAYELTALSAQRDAYLEVRRNMSAANIRFAQALMADIHHDLGNTQLMYRSLRVAWPQLATVEQDSVPAYFLKMYYPVKYSDSIEKYAAERGLDPNLVRGLILQESYYDPKVKSRVGATGLMQLMPATANDYARKLHVPFASSRLEDPDVNIKLGTFHLKMLVNMFSGNVYLAVASYNGGQGNVLKWRRAAPGKPMDEFLESIPFPETRNYVKRVTMLRSSYARIVGNS